MGNSQDEILSEIKELILSLKEKISELEAKYDELSLVAAGESEITEAEVSESEVTESEITEAEISGQGNTVAEVSESEVTESEVTESGVTEEISEQGNIVTEVSESEITDSEVTEVEGIEAEITDPATTDENLEREETNREEERQEEVIMGEDLPLAEEEMVPIGDDLPFAEETEVVDLSQRTPMPEEDADDSFGEDAWKIRPALIDSMAIYPWRKDMPGTEVRDIRSAVSLNDRLLFINTLFREDPVLFQSTLERINAMQTLVDVESYISENFPEWKMDSEIVYRFMMAVRRKVRR